MTAAELFPDHETYADAAGHYLHAGWAPLPLPAGRKTPPPTGYTGADGAWPTSAQLTTWCAEPRHRDGNIGLRLPGNVVGIDVDQYGQKAGADNLGAVVEQAGLEPLPPTWRSSSRGADNPSGISFYRIPDGRQFPGSPCAHVEFIQRHHRYAVVWPSIHPETHNQYTWFTPDGAVSQVVPTVDELPELPASWLAHNWTTGTTPALEMQPAEQQGRDPFMKATATPTTGASKAVTEAVANYYRHCSSGSRHDAMTAAVMALVRLELQQHPGAEAAFQEVAAAFTTAVVGDGSRTPAEAAAEVDRARRTADQKVTAVPSIRPSYPELVASAPARTSSTQDTDHAGASEVVSPDRFFDSRTGLLHARLRTEVLKLGAVRVGPGGSLWWYSGGVYLAHGDDEVRRRVSDLLGDRHRKSHADGIVADLAAGHQFITDLQPLQYVNCRNGLLNWQTGQLEPHSDTVPSTYQLQVDWDPTATCPRFTAWLEQVIPDDAVQLMWEVIGTCIYAGQPFQRAVLLLGPGGNGKGTLLRVITALIGARHCSSITLSALSENRFAAAELFGKVANLAGDLDAKRVENSALFKQVTGGDLITAERKHGQPFQFTSSATWVVSANEVPPTNDTTAGFFRRFIVVPMTRLRLNAGTEDPSVEAGLMLELQGILAGAVAGLQRCMANRKLSIGATVGTATEAFKAEADPMRRFVSDCVTITGDWKHQPTRPAVYERYTSWCAENGHSRPLAANRFWQQLGAIDDRIVTDGPKRDGLRHVAGIQLNSEHNHLVISSKPASPPTMVF